MKRRSLFSLLLASSAGAALAGSRLASGGTGSPRSRSVLVLLELRGDLIPSLNPPELYRRVRMRWLSTDATMERLVLIRGCS